MKAYKRQEGFTLIELLVVIAILGILAAVVIPAVTNFIGEGDEEAGETELHNVSLSVASLMADPSTPIHALGGANCDPRITPIAAPSLCTVFADVADPTTLPTLAVQDLATMITFTAANGVDPYIGENEAQPLTEYSQKDVTENWYCVEEDGTVHGWLDSDGTYIENL